MDLNVAQCRKGLFDVSGPLQTLYLIEFMVTKTGSEICTSYYKFNIVSGSKYHSVACGLSRSKFGASSKQTNFSYS